MIAANTPERKAGKTDIGADRRALNNTVRRWLRVWDLPKAVIAQVHGYCLAGGTQLASMCDITIISEDCKVGLPAAGPLGAGLMAAEALSGFSAGIHLLLRWGRFRQAL